MQKSGCRFVPRSRNIACKYIAAKVYAKKLIGHNYCSKYNANGKKYVTELLND